MNFQMNKKTIIALAVLVVVCCGSILGIKAMNDSLPEPQPTQPTVMTTLPTAPPTTEPTTAPTTTAPTTTEPTTTAPTTTSAPLTLPTMMSTTMPTTAATTMPSFTMPSIEIPTTNANSSPQSIIDNAVLFDQGFMSYKFNPDGNFYYTNDDPWQRALGFTEAYDIAAPFVSMYLDTIRCKFRYDNKDWMIQFWKGQYGYVFVGAEIGVYTKPTSRTAEFYDCASDEDSLYMSMTCYRNGEEIFTRDYSRYWWCTGFVPGTLKSFSDRSELMVKCRITVKDYKMLLAFTGALKENGYIDGEDFRTSGLDVFFTWQ